MLPGLVYSCYFYFMLFIGEINVWTCQVSKIGEERARKTKQGGWGRGGRPD